MEDRLWDKFITYVNAYYALQEACIEREQRPGGAPQGLEEFCSEANPFLWDGAGSADPTLYEDFSKRFEEKFGGPSSTADDGLEFCHIWLRSCEGPRFGTELVSSFDSVVSDPTIWAESYIPISEQVNNRMVMNELSPQENPEERDDFVDEDDFGDGADFGDDFDDEGQQHSVDYEEFETRQATLDDVPEIAAILSSERRLRTSDFEAYLTRNMQHGVLAQQLAEVDDRIVSTAGVLFVELMPSTDNPSGMVGLIVGVGSKRGYEATLSALIEQIENKAEARGVPRLFLCESGTVATDTCLDYGFESAGDLLSLLV